MIIPDSPHSDEERNLAVNLTRFLFLLGFQYYGGDYSLAIIFVSLKLTEVDSNSLRH